MDDALAVQKRLELVTFRLSCFLAISLLSLPQVLHFLTRHILAPCQSILCYGYAPATPEHHSHDSCKDILPISSFKRVSLSAISSSQDTMLFYFKLCFSYPQPPYSVIYQSCYPVTRGAQQYCTISTSCFHHGSAHFQAFESSLLGLLPPNPGQD